MTKPKDLILMLTDDAFNKNSWAAELGLFNTFKKVPFDELLTLPPGQDYPVWTLAAHVTFYKHMMCNMLGAGLEDFIYPGGNFPLPPGEKTEAEWEKMLDYMEDIQKHYEAAIRDMKDEMFDQRIKKWNMSWEKAFLLMYSHDVYHTAQIKNGWHHLF